MILNNITVLKSRYPNVWEKYKDSIIKSRDKVSVEQSKTNDLVIAITKESGLNYIHSKYNPIQEANRFIESIKDIGEKHVLFYGVGLGYHIDTFVEMYPETSFSIYEPNFEIFQELLRHKNLELWSPGKRMKKIMVEENPDDCRNNLLSFTNLLSEEIYIAILPSYERIFADETKNFMDTFRQVIYERRQSINTGKLFAKRKIINGFRNIPYMMSTPDFMSKESEAFKGKPAIIVSAGPSLNDEYENLRYIKSNGLAYIFSVGSAVNALLSQGIEPDGTFSYDGSILNQKVFTNIKSQGIDQVPLIFGSTIGFETIMDYPGKMANFSVERDSIVNLFLKRIDGAPIEQIGYFTSVATLALEVLLRKQFSPIILVGQNFAYRADLNYAKGIDYIDTALSDQQKNNALNVVDVEGNLTLSSRLHIDMRKEMEQAITAFPTAKIMNSSKGGAHIEGTVYKSLEEIIETSLITSNVVAHDWFEQLEHDIKYDLEHFKKTVLEMSRSAEELSKIFRRFEDIITEMKHYITTRNTPQLEKLFNVFDKMFDRLQKNKYNLVIIQPMNNIIFQLVMNVFEEVRFSPDPVSKAKKVTDEFGDYLRVCQEDLLLTKKLLEEMDDIVLEKRNLV
ncbi:conserved hypothetical protein [Brevibacillus brevis NBRC 100599]|uniref:6-hydroxymethylpterin diphosphokinase MptE-like domain-containing protein n=1 Tax=Brevibacillus brevis (strain 47 / JCM 6285 / NBRC 100599) TaxID=358681 RepID=C0Z6W1_BREBN|nr:6-hydroxymethylpterin diphosphokinase MptE-like protein [Brevibacillus brevis]BAH46310.1 conserved hypothetical protein [Brevibacillus brevis NBRC 100599]